MNPSPADDTIGSVASPDYEDESLIGINRDDTDDFEILEACFDSGASRSPSSSVTSLTSPTPNSSQTKQSSNETLEIVEPFRPDQVRWFYKEEGDKKWTPFIGYDSLRLECAHQEICQRTDSDTDSARGSVASALSGSTNASSSAKDIVENPRVSVLGGLHEADVANRKIYPIYWNHIGEHTAIARGTWFIDYTWQPIEEIYADDIETEHLHLYQNVKADVDKVDPAKPTNSSTAGTSHTLRLKDFKVEWENADKVYLHYQATSSKFYRKLGLGRGTRLRRTYCTEATMDDRPADISHLVFVVHGIGQKMDSGSITKSCNDLRDTCNKAMKHTPKMETLTKRAEYLPVEWRSSLTLDGDTVETVTPNRVRGLRNLLNASAMDILYYTSPKYRSEITHGLQSELNRLYNMFCERNPYFEPGGGKVSVVAHSLGVVIMYDILMAWNPVQLYDQFIQSELQDEAEKHEASALVSQLEAARSRVHDLEAELRRIMHKNSTALLNFSLENLFCLGSPLAVFLALRGVRPTGANTQDHILPRHLCGRLLNIYHPSDPIAYRLEPLILKHYETLCPMQIHRYDQVDKPRYEDIPAQPMTSSSSKTTTASTAKPTKPSNEDKEETTQNSADTRKDLSKEVSVDEGAGVESKGRLSGVWSLWSGRKPQTGEINAQELTDLQKECDKKAAENSDTGESDDADSIETEDAIDAVAAEELFTGVEDNYQRLQEEQHQEEGGREGEGDGKGEAEGGEGDTDHPQSDARSCSSGEPEDMAELRELEWRMDYQLREGKMESAYLATLTAHTAYWINLDVGVFILTQLFPNIDEIVEDNRGTKL